MSEAPFTVPDRPLGQGRYAIDRVFADGGGMGILYAARDLRCAGNMVLLKTTRYDGGEHARHFQYGAADAERHILATRKILEWEKKILVRFRGEGLNNLPSPNDFFYDRSVTLQPRYQGKHGVITLGEPLLAREPYLVMEYIEGQMLESRMREPGWRVRLEWRLLVMARELLTILIKMHKRIEVGGQPAYFIYQDLKPANVLVSGEDYFTLVDFGATTLHLGGRTTEPTAGCITPGYAAPEADRGQEARIDARFDLYSLGATLWHAVTLTDPRELGVPFPTLDPNAMRPHGVSDAFTRLVTRALSPDPGARFERAATMRKAVMDLLRARSG